MASAGRTLVIAGPTCSGKSTLALALAERFGGDIICGDSRQLFADMRIGTAAPSEDERSRVVHRGFLRLAPGTPYNAGNFITDTDAFIADAHAAGRMAIVVGGSGLYLRALYAGLSDVPPADQKIRDELEARIDAEGLDALYDELVSIDPEQQGRIARADRVRITRALEVFQLTGTPPSVLRKSHAEPTARIAADWFLLDADMAWLEARIFIRARHMFDSGLVEEAQTLMDRLAGPHPLLETMGYREALDLVAGRIDREAAIEKCARRQRRYAKRQRTWFKKETWWTRFAADDPDLDQNAAQAALDAGLRD